MAELEEISGTEGGGAQAAGQAGGGHEGGAQGGQVAEAGAEAQAPPMPPRAAPRLSSVQVEAVKEYITEIRSEVAVTTKNIVAANYRISSLDKMIPQVNRSLLEKNNLKGPIIQSLVNQILSTVESVDQIISKLEESSVNVNVNLDIIKDFEEIDGFNPNDFTEDIEYTRRNLKYKIEKLQNEFLVRKTEIENAQALIALTESRMQKSTSLSSSRNSSPNRPLVRSNADSLKPPILNYSEASVTTVKEHLQRVSDWVNNIFPGGYTFPNYLSNFISSVDKQFSIKAKRFSSCKTEDNVADMLDELMELKFPIHSRRIECLNPSIQSNEETSSF